MKRNLCPYLLDREVWIGRKWHRPGTSVEEEKAGESESPHEQHKERCMNVAPSHKRKCAETIQGFLNDPRFHLIISASLQSFDNKHPRSLQGALILFWKIRLNILRHQSKVLFSYLFQEKILCRIKIIAYRTHWELDTLLFISYFFPLTCHSLWSKLWWSSF